MKEEDPRPGREHEHGRDAEPAARLLRIGRDALRYKLKKHGL